MTSARPSWTERTLRWLVRLLPAEFRFDFRRPIEADLDERLRAGDRSGLLRREVPSLAGAVVREHSSAFVSDLQQDVKYALCTIRRTPGFAAMAVLMLALGTGVNAALFSVIDAVMLRSPFTRPEQIVLVQVVDGKRVTGAVPVERFDALVESRGVFQSVSAVNIGTHILTGLAHRSDEVAEASPGEPRSLDVECVSAAMFDVLGARPMLGRTFSAEEDRPGAMPTLVASYALWQMLGGSPSVIGSTVTVNKTPVLVVGVMGPNFAGPRSRADVAAWLPFRRPVVGGGATGCASPRAVNVFARVPDGMTLDQARAASPGLAMVAIDDQVLGDLRQPFLVLTGAVAFVLLIACFNVGGLQMERTLARRREMALRLALGAGRGRLVRQALTENIVLALAGAIAGLAATWLTLRALISVLPSNLPHLDQIAINGRVLVVTIAVASAAGIIAGLLPIAQMRRVDPGRDIRSARTGERQSTWTRRGLVVAEVALSVVVLIAAALMVQTLLTLRFRSLGFDPDGKVSQLIQLPGTTPDASAQFYNDLFDRVKSAGGIQTVVGSTYLPMRGNISIVPVSYSGNDTEILGSDITPGYFELMKIQVRAGRAFADGDASGSEPVAIVNESLARKIQPDGQVLGQMLAVAPTRRPGQPMIPRRIVGIAVNTRSAGFDTRTRDEVYLPFAQDPGSALYVIAEHGEGNGAAVAAQLRNAARALRPDIALGPPEFIPQVLDRSVRFWRFGAWLLGVFASLAVALAAIGLMTTIGWWVNQRTRELGVRIALGATRADVTRLVFRQGLTLGALGIAAGCLLAAWATKLLEGWIRGIAPRDPSTFAGCAFGMLVITALAVYLPVRRATSVDPVVALRAE